MLPEAQRRDLDELTDNLDLTAGDSVSKQSAFWTMLALSAVIASAGVLADSTATVIGAMIIAPLSTPIMGIALGVAKREAGAARRAGRFAVLGVVLVVAIGVVFSFFVPGSFDLLGNSQISGRTSPGLLDLVAAIATGFAGAVALARRDVAAVLPGVAIAISLVPPLAVVGVCLGQGALNLALGALLLFTSNLLALVLAGTLVFAGLAYQARTHGLAGPEVFRRRAYLTLAVGFFVVIVPLLGNTLVNVVLQILQDRVNTVAEEWIAAVPGASVQSVEFVSNGIYVRVQTPGDIPPVEDLLTDLEGRVPDGLPLVVSTSLGEQIQAGSVGQ